MSVDATVKQRKYPDEVWVLALDWTPALDGDTLDGDVAVTAVGVELRGMPQQDGNVTKVKIGGGGGGNGYDLSARLEFLATISTGEKLGFNLGVPTRAR